LTISAWICLRSDHGGEFENEPSENFCEKHGIFHKFSSFRTPQQNGIIERKDRSLQEMVRKCSMKLKLLSTSEQKL